VNSKKVDVDSMFLASTISPLLGRDLLEDAYYDDEYGYSNSRWVEPGVPGPDVWYRINSHGFRCDTLSSPDKNSINILVAGDSLTFGEGIPAEFMWSNQLAGMVHQKTGKNVSVTNLSVMGGSARLAVRNIFAYIRNYGIPDYIFVLIPSVTRNIIYNENLKSFTNFYYHVNKTWSQNKIVKRHVKHSIKEDSLLTTIDSMRMLEDLCSAYGIKVVWSSWEPMDQDVLAKIDFTGYIEYPHEFSPGKNDSNLPYWELANDGSHPGTAWNINMSRVFFDTMDL
jgi:hypothetical protein